MQASNDQASRSASNDHEGFVQMIVCAIIHTNHFLIVISTSPVYTIGCVFPTNDKLYGRINYVINDKPAFHFDSLLAMFTLSNYQE